MKSLNWLMPRSITAQVTGLVAVSVFLGVALLITILLLIVPSPNDDARTLASIAEITRLMREATTAEAAAVLAVAHRGDSKVERVAINNLVPTTRDSQPFLFRLALRQLAARPDVEVLTGLRNPAVPESQVITRLNDSEALVFSVSIDSRVWPILLGPTALIIVITTVSMVLLSLYAVRWIIAPLAAVAKAAVSFGRSPQDSQALRRIGPQEIIQVTDALNDMRTRIRALLDDRSRMLAAISHDLKTPLTRLRLRTERVADVAVRTAMLSDVTVISHMLDETLEYLRDDARSEANTVIDLASLLQTICSDFSDTGRAVSYEGPARLPYCCSPHALSRAITNIVENAVKHGSMVTVALTSKTDNQSTIDIVDDGPGIPAALRNLVFEPFFKVDAARRSNSGSDGFGLGLSIARDIIKRHGGDIEMKPREPTGLWVSIVMPSTSGCMPNMDGTQTFGW